MTTEHVHAHARDHDAIRAVEAAYDAAWKRGDLEALLGCLASDAVIVNPLGETARGHDEIRTMLRPLLGGSDGGSEHTSRLRAVELITDDVAIVDGEAVVTNVTTAGSPGPSTVTHRFTDILVRRDGAWTIAHVRAYAMKSGPTIA